MRSILCPYGIGHCILKGLKAKTARKSAQHPQQAQLPRARLRPSPASRPLCKAQQIAAVHIHLRMLRCGPSLRPFAHGAAFLLAETSVCGRSVPLR